jgi:hypothetical protein
MAGNRTLQTQAGFLLAVAHAYACALLLVESERKYMPKIWYNGLTQYGTLSCSRSRSRSRRYITTDGQSVSQSVCQGIEPILGLVTRYYFLSEGCFLKVAVLSPWGTLSDERSGL